MNPKIYLLMFLIGVLLAAVNLSARSKAQSGRLNEPPQSELTP
jgi:hypothetical protein